MKNTLKTLYITDFLLGTGQKQSIPLTYEVFGLPLGGDPVVLVNHALTGNSTVAGEDGWWNSIIGHSKTIDSSQYTILAFNIPGNGYDGYEIENYQDFTARDIAKLFVRGVSLLGINALHAIIGCSLGGGISWEMAIIKPFLTKHLVAIATDWKATDWLVANCLIQDRILNHSSKPIEDARMHAMLCYRTPASFKERFNRSLQENSSLFSVESWLHHHGNSLKKRFSLASYKLMNHLLYSIDVTKDRKEGLAVLDSIQSSIHIIGVDSDLFFTAEENRETYQQLAQTKHHVTYHEIHSVHGHDAFLIETDQVSKYIAPIFTQHTKNKPMKILKFGGKSLANGKGIKESIAIIKDKISQGEHISVVASARGNTTDALESLLHKAAANEPYTRQLVQFEKDQRAISVLPKFSIDREITTITNLLEGVELLGDYSLKVKDKLLAQGELISVKTIASLLEEANITSHAVDSRQLITTDTNFGNAKPLYAISKQKVKTYFNQIPKNEVAVVTGFIAANENAETTTLGRNGSNYTASLLANFLDAEELENYTHVNGIYTANPDLVSDAHKITSLSYSEANELANFGANILHAKTIIPLLEKNIRLRVLNTFNREDKGTLISSESTEEGIKSLSVLENVALVSIEGRGLLGKVGVDARIFKALSEASISVSIISQGSSERGIGLVVEACKATKAVLALEKEFERDFYRQDVHKIDVVEDISVISIIGLALSDFHLPYSALIKNQIVPILFNNTVTGKNVSIVVKDAQLHKALNVIHGELFSVAKKVNIAIFGHGQVGSALIEQIRSSKAQIENKKGIALRIFAIANSTQLVLDKNGIDTNWEETIATAQIGYEKEAVFAYAKENHLENLVLIDNTASSSFVQDYAAFVSEGFDIVSSNKIANTIGLDFYKNLRNTLKKYNKKYLYETNVGAGLPLIDTINLLHLSGENITRIRGVFSGSLSYIFNRFSNEATSFTTCLKAAQEKGYTEPDPREDLSGNDVARKLLILARELDLNNELTDVKVQNLIPESLQGISLEAFHKEETVLNAYYETIKKSQKADHVLRYIGDLSGDLSKINGADLSVTLSLVPKDSPLGQLKGSDSLFEIYTESYGERPIIIQGAGAGASVTARGVFGDLLRITENQ